MIEYEINPKIIVYEDGYIFNSETGESFFVNHTGFKIIEFIKSKTPYDKIKEYFLENYEVEDFEFERYFFEFIDLLKIYKILL